MNTDERRSELLEKANKLIDTISESMRTVENAEAAKKKFLRADAALSLEIPIQGTGGMVDVFKLKDIFDERGIEKIKAFILTELELLEESNLKLLEAAGFVEHRQDNVPQTEAADTDLCVIADLAREQIRPELQCLSVAMAWALEKGLKLKLPQKRIEVFLDIFNDKILEYRANPDQKEMDSRILDQSWGGALAAGQKWYQMYEDRKKADAEEGNEA